MRVWKAINEMFDCLPFSAVIEDKILCVHAGLSPELQSLEQLKSIPRPTEIPDAGLICDLLWSDPEEGLRGWGESDRGVSFTFGEDVVTKFLARTDLDLVARAHQVRPRSTARPTHIGRQPARQQANCVSQMVWSAAAAVVLRFSPIHAGGRGRL